MAHDASVPPPPWLLRTIREFHPDHLIRVYLRYGNIDDALETALKMVQTSTSTWGQACSGQAGSTWTPYTVLDAVLKASEEHVSERAFSLRKILKTGIENRVIRLQKHSEMTKRLAVEA